MTKRQQKPQQKPQQNGNARQMKTRDETILDTKGLLMRHQKEFEKALVKRVPIDLFLRMCMTTFQRSPKLLEADPRSFVGACMDAAQLGLQPDHVLGEAYLIPRWSKQAKRLLVNMQVGYPGWIKLVRRGGEVSEFCAEVVRSNDHFRVWKGTGRKIEHVPWYSRGETEPGEIVAAYATAELKGASQLQIEVVPKQYLDRVMRLSGDPRNDEPSEVWKEWPEPMSRKTAAVQLCKWLPLPDEMKRAAQRDILREAGIDEGSLVEATARDLADATSLDDLIPPPSDDDNPEDSGEPVVDESYTQEPG